MAEDAGVCWPGDKAWDWGQGSVAKGPGEAESRTGGWRGNPMKEEFRRSSCVGRGILPCLFFFFFQREGYIR